MSGAPPSLEQIYADSGRPGATKFRQAVLRAGRRITLKAAQEFIQKREESQVFRAPTRSEGVLTATQRNITWQVDLIDFTSKDKTKNDGYEYILLAIDVFSRFLYAEPLKKKAPADAAAGFTAILRRASGGPKEVALDDGGEFQGAFRTLLTRLGMSVRQKEQRNSLAAVDAVIRTLKQTLSKEMTAKDSESWSQHLQGAVRAYNSNSHPHLLESAPKEVAGNTSLQYHLEREAGEDILHNKAVHDRRKARVEKAGAFRLSVREPENKKRRVERPRASGEVFDVAGIRGNAVRGEGAQGIRVPLRSVVAVPIGSKDINPPGAISGANVRRNTQAKEDLRRFIPRLSNMLQGGRRIALPEAARRMRQEPGFADALKQYALRMRDFLEFYPESFTIENRNTKQAKVRNA